MRQLPVHFPFPNLQLCLSRSSASLAKVKLSFNFVTSAL